jgi:high-affinity K+ transport system ATPase subunit B
MERFDEKISEGAYPSLPEVLRDIMRSVASRIESADFDSNTKKSLVDTALFGGTQTISDVMALGCTPKQFFGCIETMIDKIEQRHKSQQERNNAAAVMISNLEKGYFRTLFEQSNGSQKPS